MAYLIAFLLLLTAAAIFLLLVADSLYRHRDQAIDLTERHAADLHLGGGGRVTLTRAENPATDSPVLPVLVRKRLGIVIAVALGMAFLLLLVA